MKDKKDFKLVGFVLVCIFVNYFGRIIGEYCGLPFWLDSIGTVFSAYYLGPVCGSLIGSASHIIYGFKDPVACVYLIVGVAIAITVGICAKKNKFNTFFSAVSVGALVTGVCVIISTPLNCIFYEGYLGNRWGDGIISMLTEWDIGRIPASFLAELYIDFLDKTLTILLLFFGKKLFEKRNEKKEKPAKEESRKKIAATILLICAAITSFDIYSPKASGTEDIDYNSYIQTVYSNDNGLLSGEANDIAATNDGILWIGTYAGLYRYSGQDFRYINRFPEVKNVNCLYVDDEGRMWIGTNDNGVSLCINEEIVNTVNDESGLPTNSVRSIVQQSGGNYFIGTSSSLVSVSLSNGMNICNVIPEINYATILSADENNHVAAVTSAGDLFVIDDVTVIEHIQATDSRRFSSCMFDENGNLYAGDDSGELYVYSLEADKLKEIKKINCSQLSAINSIDRIEDGTIFLSGENGIAYMNKNNAVKYINSNSFNSSIDHMTVDYQGNLWFSSSRLGVLKLCKTSFSELYPEIGIPEKVTNSVVVWNDRIYVGTDNGLDIIDKKRRTVIKDSLSEQLRDVRIRSVRTDSSDNLWICTYGMGAIKVTPDGAVRTFSSSDGMIGTKFRCSAELDDGTMAIAGDLGINFIKNNRVTATISREDGLENTMVLSLEVLEDGTLLAGTDGGGIAAICDEKLTYTVGKHDGIGSDVILRIVEDKDADAAFVITSNGISYLEFKDGGVQARVLDNFPYSNNYDLYDDGQGKLFVTGSAGIYIADKKGLLSGSEDGFILLNYLNGLRGTLTANSWNCVDGDIFYISNCTGVTMLDLNIYKSMVRSYRLLLNNIYIDGEEYRVKKGEDIDIPRGVKQIHFKPEVINYSSGDPLIRYYMEGIDDEPTVVAQSELGEIYYSNLPAGDHRLHISICDNTTGRIISEHVYVFSKNKEIYDNWWFRVYFVVEALLIIAWATWFITRSFFQKILNIQRREIEMAKEQIKIGNETILAIAKTVDAKDSNTSEHSTRVSEYSVLIAEKLGYDDEQRENLRKAALLHDIGKIGVPDSVLNKPAKLTDEEYAIMKQHVTIGGDILKDFTLISNVQDGAMYHHERWDGKGYVKGLKGEEIPEWARIIGIADAFDAMTANRVYRKKLDFSYVLEELKRCRGTQFDPKMVDILLELIQEGKISVEEEPS